MTKGPKIGHRLEAVQHRTIWEDPFLVKRMTEWFEAGASARVVWENLFNMWDKEARWPAKYEHVPKWTMKLSSFEAKIGGIKSGVIPAALQRSEEGKALIVALQTHVSAPENFERGWTNTTRFLVAYMNDVLHVPAVTIAKVIGEHFPFLKGVGANAVKVALSSARGKSTPPVIKYPFRPETLILQGTKEEEEQFFRLMKTFTKLPPDECLKRLGIGTKSHQRFESQFHERIQWSDENLFLLAGLVSYCDLHPIDVEKVLQDIFKKEVRPGYGFVTLFEQKERHPDLLLRAPTGSEEKRGEFEKLLKGRIGLSISEVTAKYQHPRRKSLTDRSS